MAAAIDEHTRLVFIANPNNPTGTWNSGKEIRSFLQKVPANVIVVLDEAAPVTEFAALPEPGLVDTLAMGTQVDIVGYGVQERAVGGGPPVWLGTLTRYYAPSQLVASNDRINDMFIKLTANPAQGKGGTCFGDSGGADFLGDTNIILGVNSFVTNGNCAGVTYSQRIDIPVILEWIESFL